MIETKHIQDYVSSICTECGKKLTDKVIFNCTICNPKDEENGSKEETRCKD